MKRLLPAPLLSVALFALWLLLNDSLEPRPVGCSRWSSRIAVPLLTAPLRPQRGAHAPSGPRRCGSSPRSPPTSSSRTLDVALRASCGAALAQPRGAFVAIPLDLRDANALAALAIITTVVPGHRLVRARARPQRAAAARLRPRRRGRLRRPLQGSATSEPLLEIFE